MLLNAPGVKPTPERVEDVARRSLGLDEAPDEPTPEFYLPVLEKFLTDNPADDHFLLELPEKRDPSRGGNGFGSVTCMEDECWVDTTLSADPDQPDGGRENGLGSFYEYALHCQEEHHIRGRAKRLNENDITLPARSGASGAVLPQDIADLPSFPTSNGSAEAGPSRPFPASSPSWRLSGTPHNQSTSAAPHPSAPSRLQTQSNILQDHNVNIPSPSTGSKFKGKGRAISVDSDSDDEILFLGATSPSKRVVVVDSDDEVKPLKSSQVSGSSASQPARLWIPAWSGMALTERRKAIATELGELAKPPVNNNFERTRAVARRKDHLDAIKESNYLMQWTPPEDLVLEAYPDLTLHEKLNNTFDRPERVQQQRGQPFSTAGQAGPSSIPDAAPLVPPFNHTGYVPAFLQSAWNGIDKMARLQYNLKEMQLIRDSLLRWRSHPNLQALVKMLEGRYHQMSQALGNNNGTWTPPSKEVLRCLPHLRAAVHPALSQFLPPVEVQPPSLINDDMFEEYDRPMGRDLHAFFQDALEDFKEDTTVEEGLKVLGLDAISDKIPGANFTLMPHQVLGVQFMVKREERASVRGGLLCDAMGLGKTVQCIALMLLRDERPQDFRKCPQLIVAPLALLLQWKTEIETKTTRGWRIVIHHGQNRSSSAAALRNYDIVLTTYGTLMSESGLSSEEKKKKKRPVGSDDESEEEVRKPRKKKGPLFGVKWFRVILDEAHNCRNKRTRTARAILLLDCLHPWPITGSPVVNSLADLGVSLEFIGAMDLKEFQNRVVLVEKKKPRLAAKRCQAIMKPLMFRRNKDTMLNGRKILELPPKVTNMAWLDFEADERAIYAAIEQRAKVRVNKYIQRGTLMKNYTIVLQLLTRLRQCVNHPWLLRRKPGEESREDDLLVDDDAFGANLEACREKNEDEYGRAVALLGGDAVLGIKEKLKERYERMTDEAEDTKESQDMECSICYEPFDGTELITPCGHLYCKPCLQNLFSQPNRDGHDLNDDDVQNGNRSCPMCRTMLVPGRVFRAAAIYTPSTAPTPEEEAEEVEEVDKKPVIDRKGKKRALTEAESFFENLRDKKPKIDNGQSRAPSAEDDDDEDEVEVVKEKVPPSSKLRKLLELVMGYLREDPTVKILVFSQFVQFLDLVSEFLEEEGIKCLHYRGAMSQNQREEAIRRFSTPPAISDSIPIMLISTKAGGVGLNLTMASKVIMCDLAWNPATENQAVDRAHRIGQNNEVQVERLLIRETVEDRLLEIQERKGLLADGALGEGDVGRLGRLNIDDIRRLFAIDRDLGRDDD